MFLSTVCLVKSALFAKQAVSIFRHLALTENNFAKKKLLADNLRLFDLKLVLLESAQVADHLFDAALDMDEKRSNYEDLISSYISAGMTMDIF